MVKNPSAQYSINGGTQNVAMKINIPPVIVVSRDTIHLKLKEFRSRILLCAQFGSAMALFLSTLAVVLTADSFRGLLLSGEQWASVYFGIAVCSGVWGLVVGVRLLANFKKMSDEYALQEICIAKQADVPVTVSAEMEPSFANTPLKK